MKGMTISKAAYKADVGVETIRFYERKGLIAQPPKPEDSAFRDDPVETGQRIRFIRLALEIGFSRCEIEELLSLRADPAADCSDMRGRTTAKLTEVDRKIAHFKQIRGALEALIAACPDCGALRARSILEALTDAEDGVVGANGRDEPR